LPATEGPDWRPAAARGAAQRPLRRGVCAAPKRIGGGRARTGRPLAASAIASRHRHPARRPAARALRPRGARAAAAAQLRAAASPWFQWVLRSAPVSRIERPAPSAALRGPRVWALLAPLLAPPPHGPAARRVPPHRSRAAIRSRRGPTPPRALLVWTWCRSRASAARPASSARSDAWSCSAWTPRTRGPSSVRAAGGRPGAGAARRRRRRRRRRTAAAPPASRPPPAGRPRRSLAPHGGAGACGRRAAAGAVAAAPPAPPPPAGPRSDCHAPRPPTQRKPPPAPPAPPARSRRRAAARVAQRRQDVARRRAPRQPQERTPGAFGGWGGGVQLGGPPPNSRKGPRPWPPW
jgi:hypothetical protein